MAVQIIIDSAADITPAQANELGVIHLPLKVLFGSEEFEDAVTLSHSEFYEKLIESDVLPTTCQIPPADFEEAYEALRLRQDTAVVITLSGKLSGTFQSAMIAAEEHHSRIHVVDSESVSLGQRLLVFRAVELRRQGFSAAEIAAQLNEEKKKIKVLALLDTLEYLKKGGRISKATALAGAMLNIKPVITLKDGEVTMVGKARGSKQGNNLLRELVANCGGINFSLPYCLAYSGLSDSLLQKYIADSADLLDGCTDHLPIATVGCVIGTHVGPGAIAIAFFQN